MTKVKFHCNWRDDAYVRSWISKYTKDGSRWNDLILTDKEDYDVLVIFNCPHSRYRFDKKRAIVFQGEPEPIRQSWGEYADPRKEDFLCVWNTSDHFNSVGWSFADSWSQIRDMEINKSKKMSGVISSKNSFPGQVHRLEFVKFLKTLPEYTHYGRGTGLPTADKSDALFPFLFTFNAENVREKNYFTEKITDAIVAECLCFYDGCPNITDFFDSRSFYRVDIHSANKVGVLEEIRRTISDSNIYSERLPFIRAMKNKIMNELQPMPLVERILSQV